MATRLHPLTTYREEADRFLAALEEEYYLHFAGHKDELDLEPVYERHAGLNARRLPGARGGRRDRRGDARAVALRLRGLPRAT